MTLDAKFQTYLSLLPTQQDHNGFIETSNCDSLLWSGLVGCVQGVTVNIDAARVGDIWFRRPVDCPSCTSTGYMRGFWRRILDCIKLKTTNLAALTASFQQGNSTISRDMIIGLLWYAWHNKRLDITEHLLSYAFKHGGFVGKGDPTKTNMMPPLMATAAWISYKLGGPNRWWLRWVPADFGGTPTDFEAHLQVMHILLRAQVTGKMSWFAKDTVQNQITRQPGNPLFQFAGGYDGAAEQILEDLQLFPDDALPTTMNYSEGEWLWQRDADSGWEPNPNIQPPQTHTGAEFLFMYALLNGKLK